MSTVQLFHNKILRKFDSMPPLKLNIQSISLLQIMSLIFVKLYNHWLKYTDYHFGHKLLNSAIIRSIVQSSHNKRLRKFNSVPLLKLSLQSIYHYYKSCHLFSCNYTKSYSLIKEITIWSNLSLKSENTTLLLRWQFFF